MSMNNDKKFTVGTWTILILLLLAAVSLFLPFITAEYSISVANLLFGKTVNGSEALPTFGIYGQLATATVVVPLFLLLLFNLSHMYRVKKYILNLLFGLWFFVGEFVMMIIITVPFEGAAWGAGFPLGIISSAALAVFSLVLGFNDKTEKRLKVSIWYKSINTIVMMVNIPALLVELVSFFVFREMLLLLSLFNLIAIAALLVATTVSCFVSINAFFGVYKYGPLNFLTGILTLITVAGLLYNSGVGGIIAGAVLALVFSALWGFLGVSSVTVMNKANIHN